MTGAVNTADIVQSLYQSGDMGHGCPQCGSTVIVQVTLGLALDSARRKGIVNPVRCHSCKLIHEDRG